MCEAHACPCQRFGELVCGLADEVGACDAALRSRAREPRERRSLEASAEDETEARRVRGERLYRGLRIRRLRVVDEANAIDLAYELETMGHALEGAQAFGDRVVGDPGGACGGGRGRGVLPVVSPEDRRLGRQLVVGRELGAARGPR